MTRQLICAALIALVVWLPNAQAAPKAELWDRWQTHDGESQYVIDHASWGYFLARYVIFDDASGQYLVRYDAVTDQDNDILTDYLARMISLPISQFTRPQQEAFWINLYNALTVRIVLNHLPVDSVRDIDISPGLFAVGPWGARLITVEGEKLSLDDIEHRILRPIWKDPRLHYALICAAKGCPHLRPWPFEPESMDMQLDRAAAEFINHKRAVLFEGRSLTVSSLYDWYADDFGADEEAIIAHLKIHAKSTLKARLERATEIDDYEYDWDLNTAD